MTNLARFASVSCIILLTAVCLRGTLFNMLLTLMNSSYHLSFPMEAMPKEFELQKARVTISDPIYQALKSHLAQEQHDWIPDRGYEYAYDTDYVFKSPTMNIECMSGRLGLLDRILLNRAIFYFVLVSYQDKDSNEKHIAKTMKRPCVEEHS